MLEVGRMFQASECPYMSVVLKNVLTCQEVLKSRGALEIPECLSQVCPRSETTEKEHCSGHIALTAQGLYVRAGGSQVLLRGWDP